LFHEFMRFARELELPVQVHTGHMSGIRNRVNKANAANFTKVLELHQEVNFDLFHGNWPYMDDILFLGKNYPNVYLDLCWVNTIDPLYSIELLERAVVTISHKKINGFGGDCSIFELIPIHLSFAQKNIAHALSKLVSRKWISKKEAIMIAADWLFNNPNELFKLGLKPYTP
jgi:predicted TIM-barrel fold metal-dependent hydrolase